MFIICSRGYLCIHDDVVGIDQFRRILFNVWFNERVLFGHPHCLNKRTGCTSCASPLMAATVCSSCLIKGAVSMRATKQPRQTCAKLGKTFFLPSIWIPHRWKTPSRNLLSFLLPNSVVHPSIAIQHEGVRGTMQRQQDAHFTSIS
jgi:hypothetical protein